MSRHNTSSAIRRTRSIRIREIPLLKQLQLLLPRRQQGELAETKGQLPIGAGLELADGRDGVPIFVNHGVDELELDRADAVPERRELDRVLSSTGQRGLCCEGRDRDARSSLRGAA